MHLEVAMRGIRSIRGNCLILGLALLVPLGPATAIEPDAPEQLITAEEGVGIQARRLLVDRKGPASEAEKADVEALVSFYAGRTSKPLWISADKLNLKAKAAAQEIARADDWGLDPKAFNLKQTEIPDGAPSGDLAQAEIALSLRS